MAITLEQIQIRPIERDDNAQLALIIRTTLAEFGANHPGTVYYDPTTDNLFELFQKTGSMYQVAVHHGNILGGGGIFPSEGLPQDTCELVKMYLLPEARGLGLGKKLISACISWANANGYPKIYLETMPELRQALKVYELFGFKYLPGPMGNTGHTGCSLWMLKE